MINETQHSSSEQPSPFGARLKSARQALGLNCKEAAAQLRLNEKIIQMMENDSFPSDMPITFVRGYFRSYGKLLQIPENEIKVAIEPIQHKPTIFDDDLSSAKQKPAMTSGNHFMQLSSFLILFTLVGLVGMWWYSHSSTPNESIAANENMIPAASLAPTPMIASADTTTAADNINAATPVAAIPATTATSASTTAPAAPTEDANKATATTEPKPAAPATAAQSASAADDDDEEEIEQPAKAQPIRSTMQQHSSVPKYMQYENQSSHSYQSNTYSNNNNDDTD